MLIISTVNHLIRPLLMEKEMNHLLLLSAMSARIDVGYPWTRLGMRESLFVDRWVVESSSGIENQYLYDTELMLTGAMGVDMLIKDWTVGFAMDYPGRFPLVFGVHLSIGKGGKSDDDIFIDAKPRDRFKQYDFYRSHQRNPRASHHALCNF